MESPGLIVLGCLVWIVCFQRQDVCGLICRDPDSCEAVCAHTVARVGPKMLTLSSGVARDYSHPLTPARFYQDSL